MTDQSIRDAVEELSSKFHDVYMKEAHRQGRVLHPDKYEDLEENIKEYDRVLARFVLEWHEKEKERMLERLSVARIVDVICRSKVSELAWKYCDLNDEEHGEYNLELAMALRKMIELTKKEE